ncbi:hypothetical protein SEVIR_4G207850v4 [Setaria viridis]
MVVTKLLLTLISIRSFREALLTFFPLLSYAATSCCRALGPCAGEEVGARGDNDLALAPGSFARTKAPGCHARVASLSRETETPTQAPDHEQGNKGLKELVSEWKMLSIEINSHS